MKELVIALVLGIGIGGLYAMLGVGLVTAYKGSGVINFAHGAFGMYAAFTFSELRASTGPKTSGDLVLPWIDFLPTKGLNIPVRISLSDAPGGVNVWVALTLSLLMAMAIGLLAHLLVFRPLRNSPALGKVVGAVGLMIYLQAVAQKNFSVGARQDPGFLPDNPPIRNILSLGANMKRLNVWLALAGVLMALAVWALLRFTRFGLTTRASDENEKGAALLGYNPQRVAGTNWVLSAFLAAVAALVAIGLSAVQVNRLTTLVVPALSAALIGNLSSIPLTALGGFALGMFQSGMVDLAGREWWPEWLPATGVRDLIPLLAIVLVLFFKGDRLPIRGSIVQRRQPLSLPAKRVWLGVVVPVLLVWLLSNRFTGKWEVALTQTIVLATLMMSLVVVVGFLGQISLIQLSLAGVAAYTAVRLASDGTKDQFSVLVVDGPGLPDPLAFVGGVLAALLVGLVIALPALRIRGVQLAVVTLAAIDPIKGLIFSNTSLMSEAAASNMPVPKPYWFGQYVGGTDPGDNIGDYWKFTVFAVFWAVVVGVAVVNIRRGVVGRRFLAIRANERAAAAAGIDVARNKLLGFGFGAVVAGIAGVVSAYRVPQVGVENYELFIGLGGVFAFAYLGGITSVYGAIVGGVLGGSALVATIVGNFTGDDFGPTLAVLGGIGVIVQAIANPEGIATGNVLLFRHLTAKRAAKRSGVPLPAAAVSSGGGH